MYNIYTNVLKNLFAIYYLFFVICYYKYKVVEFVNK